MTDSGTVSLESRKRFLDVLAKEPPELPSEQADQRYLDALDSASKQRRELPPAVESLAAGEPARAAQVKGRTGTRTYPKKGSSARGTNARVLSTARNRRSAPDRHTPQPQPQAQVPAQVPTAKHTRAGRAAKGICEAIGESHTALAFIAYDGDEEDVRQVWHRTRRLSMNQ